ncbi:hypothetical protein JRO89_XS04G0029100 [Xanthoceras sorbifolium]|uniref:Transmembrane protein n=1 Tax=Xanthoceras sorbifolium TaxID=99658 RepID=A0ABQ8I4R0_9ROSI|nr:hypothetical protein JRO89_XS04G0029100 [Xanthoceras sorbifolium]
MGCPQNSIVYNGSLCACPPGQLFNRTAGGGCAAFGEGLAFSTDSGVDYYGLSFPETIFAFDSIKKFSQSQAVFLEATLVMMLSWLLMCLFLRFAKLGDGRSIWFRLRWWVSRLDICFATRHWLDDQKVVTKRKTELGGTFSIASWILFIGLFAALLYQIISKRTIEVHNVRATNAPDLAAFINDMEFNITTVSSMSCSNLRGLGTLVTGSPGFVDFRLAPLSSFVNYSCHNTSTGPTLSFKCTDCHIIHDYLYISWQFVDLPNNPASAVGFRFNYTAKHRSNKKHLSFVSGTVKNGSAFDDTPVTFRGTGTNILKFNLFPHLYHNLHDLRLLQPLFHEFVPGSSFHETTQLRASLERSSDGLLNTTLYINYLSSYIIEIENRSIIGPGPSYLGKLDTNSICCGLSKSSSIVSKVRIACRQNITAPFWSELETYQSLACLFCIPSVPLCSTAIMLVVLCLDLLIYRCVDRLEFELPCRSWWLILLSIGIFFYLLVQCEYRIKKLRNEDSILRMVRNRRRAQERWDKARSISLSKWDSRSLHTREVECCITVTASTPKEKLSCPRDEPLRNHQVHGSAHTEKKQMPSSWGEHASQPQNSLLVTKYHSSTTSTRKITFLLVLTSLLKPESEVEMSDIQKNFQCLYDYNVMLREKLVAAQSSLHALAAKSSSPAPESKT